MGLKQVYRIPEWSTEAPSLRQPCLQSGEEEPQQETFVTGKVSS